LSPRQPRRAERAETVRTVIISRRTVTALHPRARNASATKPPTVVATAGGVGLRLGKVEARVRVGQPEGGPKPFHD
jgi:hypothetical protein